MPVRTRTVIELGGVPIRRRRKKTEIKLDKAKFLQKLRVASEDTDRWIMDMQMTGVDLQLPAYNLAQVLSSTTHDLKENLYLLCR